MTLTNQPAPPDEVQGDADAKRLAEDLRLVRTIRWESVELEAAIRAARLGKDNG